MKKSCNHSGHTHTWTTVSLHGKRLLSWCERCGSLGQWDDVKNKRRWTKPKLAREGK